MHSQRIRLLPAVLVAGLAMPQPAGAIRAQDAALPPDISEALQRLTSTLDAVDDYEKLLKGLEVIRTDQASCAPDQSAQSLGEALAWAIDARFQADKDLVRGRSALDACRLGIAVDALDALAQQSAQVTQMTKVFSAIPLNDAAPSATLDRLIEQTRWIAVLKSDAPDLADLARQLSEVGGDPALGARAAQARRLVEISNRADEAVRAALTCSVTPQPLAGIKRIVTTIEPIPEVARELDAAVKASTAGACASAAAPSAPKPPAGPSWLPPPPNAAAKPTTAAIPSWVPTKDAPAAVTTTTRPADLVSEARDRLLADEAQRIEEQSRRYAEARAQRAAEAERARTAQASPAPAGAPAALPAGAPPTSATTPFLRAVLTTPIPHDQALALAQRQVQVQEQQRAKRHTSFLGILGRVTAAVGVVAATGGLGAPALGAILPAIGAVSSVAAAAAGGGGVGGAVNAALGAASGVPMSPAASQALSAMRAITGQPGANPMPPLPPGAIPLSGSPTSPAIPPGAPVGYLPPSVNEPFLGRWMCTTTDVIVAPDGKQSTSSSQLPLALVDTPGGLMMSTDTGALTGVVTGGRAIFDRALPTENGTCQLRVTLQPQPPGLVGSTSVSCPKGDQITGTLQCRR